MNIFLTLILFYLGASIGSFLSVVIYRQKHNKKGILFGRSMCPKCKTELTSADLIPIFSFTIFKGKCRYCRKKISPHYIFMELLAGVIFALLYLKFPFFVFNNSAPYTVFDSNTAVMYVYTAIMASFLIGVFFYDLLYKEIPDIFTIPGIVIALIAAVSAKAANFSHPEFLMPWIKEIIYGFGLALLIFEGQRILSKGKWIGLGDSMLAFMMAILFGWKFFLIAVFAAYALGTIVSVFLLIFKKATLKTAVAFGPFLVAGSFIVIFFGEAILSTYLKYVSL